MSSQSIVLMGRPGAGKTTMRSQIFQNIPPRSLINRGSQPIGTSDSSQTTSVFDLSPSWTLTVIDIIPGETPGSFGSDPPDSSSFSSYASSSSAGATNTTTTTASDYSHLSLSAQASSQYDDDDDDADLYLPMRDRRNGWYRGLTVLVYILDLEGRDSEETERLSDVLAVLAQAQTRAKRARQRFRSSDSLPRNRQHATAQSPHQHDETAQIPRITILLHKTDLVHPSQQERLAPARKAEVLAIAAEHGFADVTEVRLTSMWDETLYGAWGASVLAHVVSGLEGVAKSATDLAREMGAREAMLLDRVSWCVLRVLDLDEDQDKDQDKDQDRRAMAKKVKRNGDVGGKETEGENEIENEAEDAEKLQLQRASRLSAIIKRFRQSLAAYAQHTPPPAPALSWNSIGGGSVGSGNSSRLNFETGATAEVVEPRGGTRKGQIGEFEMRGPAFAAFVEELRGDVAGLFVLGGREGGLGLEAARGEVRRWREEGGGWEWRRRGRKGE